MKDMSATELVPGRYYDRPVVRARWVTAALRWIPVLGPAHSDREIVNFHPVHFHVDFRFLPACLRRSSQDVFKFPISVVWPDVPGGNYVNLDDRVTLEGLPAESWYRVAKRKFNAHYPAYPHKTPHWVRELEAAYAGATLSPGLICPHKGAPLEGMQPDEDGCITCPFHGLRWNASTGQLAPRPWPEG